MAKFIKINDTIINLDVVAFVDLQYKDSRGCAAVRIALTVSDDDGNLVHYVFAGEESDYLRGFFICQSTEVTAKKKN